MSPFVLTTYSIRISLAVITTLSSTAIAQIPTAAPTYSPTGAPSHSIQQIDKWWHDDYVYNEKIAEWNNSDIGWLLHNQQIEHISQQSLLLHGAILTGDNPNLVPNGTFGATNSTLPNLGTVHGIFRSRMVLGFNEYLTLQRSFECMAISYVSIWYDVLFCRTASQLFKHSLKINGTAVPSITGKNLRQSTSDGEYQDAGAICESDYPLWKSFWWRSNSTGFSLAEDKAFGVQFEFQLQDEDDWLAVTNLTIECDLKYPSAAPTQAPSLAPTLTPTGKQQKAPLKQEIDAAAHCLGQLAG